MLGKISKIEYSVNLYDNETEWLVQEYVIPEPVPLTQILENFEEKDRNNFEMNSLCLITEKQAPFFKKLLNINFDFGKNSYYFE